MGLSRVSQLADRLPADCPVSQRLEEGAEDLDAEWVVHVKGNASLPALDLDAALAKGSPLRARIEPSDDLPETPFLILVEGNLEVDAAIVSEDARGAAGLVVLGDLHAHDVVVGGQLLYVLGTLAVRDLLWGDGDRGELRVLGGATARVALFTDDCHVRIGGGERFNFLFDEIRGVHSLAEFSSEEIAAVFPSHCFDGIDDGESGIRPMLDRHAIVQSLRNGDGVVRSDREINAFMPQAADLFQDETISVENVRALIGCGLVKAGESNAFGWFGQTDFVVSDRHQDKDGDRIPERVYITLWKAFDFHLAVRRAPRSAGLFRMIHYLVSDSPRAYAEHLDLTFRSYNEGEPNVWKPLVPEESPAIWGLCVEAWRGVLDYARKAVGQARAGYPLWQRAHDEITPARIETLAALPVFTERYNDWWDGDKCGYWESDVWVGTRRPCVRDGETYGRAFKLAWENGAEGPGDPQSDATGSYLITFEDAKDDGPALAFFCGQRQSDGTTRLRRDAADHLARLLRFFATVESKLLADHERETARALERQRIEQAATLLKAPPYAASVPDSEIFPQELLAMSARWQIEGRDYVDAIRAYHVRREHAPASEDDDAQADLPADPRKGTWPTVLQLARVVSRCDDGGLAERFRKLFAFAPDAMRSRAIEAGQFIGPVFLLDDGRVLAHIGPDYGDSSHWVAIDGLTLARLPALKGLGRSPDRRRFARSDGDAVTTHDGFDGPLIARFALPLGNEGLPDSLALSAHPMGRHCDQLIPFNDGRRVLLRNPTGIYLLDDSGVRRVHPQEFDEDGPYTWPKNQSDHCLALDMLHMALSPDERHIMVGDQDSAHLLLDANGSPERSFEPLSSYPHHAAFCHDGSRVIANSCHLYSGCTMIAHPGTDEEPATFNGAWRIYASCVTPSLFILGNAEGYLHAVDYTGRMVWRHHVGSTISGMDISPDGSVLIGASYGGYLVRLELGGGGVDPYCIGTSPYFETRRWIFWEDEEAPIRW
ncbi:MAG: WD40 repeat domain-containing protein [Sterolibacteriaceae bacterium]|nr:WD40 repeat domain-containing protein [Candidatus Methylophosphatis haderslevensis]